MSVGPVCEHVFVRWDNLKTEAQGRESLPGIDVAPVTRTFDAPEAVGIRFHEIQARSAINAVPPMSYVDFRHTINPYRGCTHACSYCLSGDTLVLCGDGRATPIAELEPDDEIYGTRFVGRYRRYVKTTVLNHWETKKQAYAVRLENGTELIASGDHRFLSDRGWKYVTGSQHGTGRRPHLTTDESLLGPDPAITRKRDFSGTAVKARNPMRIVEIEPLGREVEMFDITTGTGDFIADGVISHNCFARPTHKYLDMNAREDFEREIVVKVNLPEVLRAELRRPSWKGELIALGTNTDPYQWVEGRYRITRAIWEQLLEARNPCSVLTKSPLLLRDLDLFRKLSERAGFSASLSIPTLDAKAWRATEPGTPNPRKRIEAVAALSEAGIDTGVLVAPLMPGINDSPQQVNEILELCGEAGATSVGGIALHLRGEVRSIFLDWLRQYRPDLLQRYEELYARGGNMEAKERSRLNRLVRRGGRPRARPPAADAEERDGTNADQPAPAPQQLF